MNNVSILKIVKENPLIPLLLFLGITFIAIGLIMWKDEDSSNQPESTALVFYPAQ